MRLRILEPADAEFTVEPAIGKQKYDEGNPGMNLIYFRHHLKATEQSTIRVLFSGENIQPVPAALNLKDW